MSSEEVAFWGQLIGNSGFPIVITIYLITTFRKTLEGVKESISELTQVIKEQLK